MKVYVFGNEDNTEDCAALKVLKNLDDGLEDVQFVNVRPNEDVPFADQTRTVIIDAVQGIDEVEIIEGNNLNRLIPPPRTSTHDFDLGFQLKYLKKLGKLGEVTVIGIPKKGRINYRRIQSILRKLVAQDIQGS